MELAERMDILYGEGGVYDHVNKGEDWIIKDHGLNLKEPYLLDINKKHRMEEIFDCQIRSWKFGDGTGFEELNETGYKAYWQSRKNFYLYYYYPDDQTKHEFYFHHLKNTGDRLKNNLTKNQINFPDVEDEDFIFDLYKPIPHWVKNSEWDAPKEYDLWAINWKTPYFSSDVGNVTGNPWLAELYKADPFEAVVCLNSETARRRNLQEGDRVTVSSRYGSLEGVIRTSELFHPDAVGVSGGYGGGNKHGNPLNRKGPNFNALLSTDIKTLDAVSAGQETAPKVKIIKRGGKG